MAGLQIITRLEIISGGYQYPPVGGDRWEITGSDGGYPSWTDVSGTSGTVTARYWYHDSTTAHNSQSDRTYVTVTDHWELVGVDGMNNIHVRVNTTVDKVERTIWAGGGSGRGYLWHVMISRYEGGTKYVDVPNIVGSTPRIVAQNVSLGSYDIYLAPGGTDEKSTIYYKNATMGHEYDPLPSQFVDVMAAGISFRNTLPPDYRPGARKINGTWMSHNRNGGVADRKGFGTMRTINGGVATDNPPSKKKSGTWYNMKRIGQE